MQPLDAQGKDLNLIGNTINISAPVSSVGATLSFRPFDPTRDIAIGDESLPTVYPDSMFLGQSDLVKLMPGFKTIVFGSGLAPDQGIFIVADEQPVARASPPSMAKSNRTTGRAGDGMMGSRLRRGTKITEHAKGRTGRLLSFD